MQREREREGERERERERERENVKKDKEVREREREREYRRQLQKDIIFQLISFLKKFKFAKHFCKHKYTQKPSNLSCMRDKTLNFLLCQNNSFCSETSRLNFSLQLQNEKLVFTSLNKNYKSILFFTLTNKKLVSDK